MIDTDSSYTQPTGGNVKRALSKLVAESQHGDVALFHFSGHASKRVAEGDADYDRKGKRPAQPAAVEAPSRTIHAPEDGWLDKDGKVHRRHTADARILQRDLDDVFQIYDLLAPAEEPLRDLVEDGADLPASSPVSSAELFKTIPAALALCTTVALRINKLGKKLHVEHEYGAEVAKEFDAVDPLGGKGSADYKELKKAIEKVKAKKPSRARSLLPLLASPSLFTVGATTGGRAAGARRSLLLVGILLQTSHVIAAKGRDTSVGTARVHVDEAVESAILLA
eukprot:jgi/Tetstr1/463020/TSEL_007959.t1